MPPWRIRPSRTQTPRRWRVWPGSVASAPSWPRCWCARRCIGPSPTASRWPPRLVSRRARTPAATGSATRASPRLGTHFCGGRWSNWRGCGGAISRAAGSPAGSSSGSSPDAVASARSPRWRWRANCWLPFGGISPPGWFRRARAGRRPEDQGSSAGPVHGTPDEWGQACDRSSTGFAAVAKDGSRRLQPVRLA